MDAVILDKKIELSLDVNNLNIKWVELSFRKNLRYRIQNTNEVIVKLSRGLTRFLTLQFILTGSTITLTLSNHSYKISISSKIIKIDNFIVIWFVIHNKVICLCIVRRRNYSWVSRHWGNLKKYCTCLRQNRI
jgi:hypothetical protein